MKAGDGIEIRRRVRLRPEPEPVRYAWEAEGEAGASGREVEGEVQVVNAAEVANEPTTAELAANFTGAMARWVAAGLPVVSEAVYEQRAAACEACGLWDGVARFGLGKCLAPDCGCTRLKRWLATERCKHPKGSRWRV